MSVSDLEDRIAKLEKSLATVAKELQLALRYAQPDAAGSLNKSRVVMEKLLLHIYQVEMGKPPRKALLGDIMCDNQFTRKIERRILTRINTIRDFGNQGSHPEPVLPDDAVRALQDVCDVIEWYLPRYATATGPATSQSAPSSDSELPAVAPHLQQGLDVARVLANADFNDAKMHSELRDILVSCFNLGDSCRKAGNLEVARDYFTQGLEIARKLAAAGAKDPATARDPYVFLQSLGEVAVLARDHDTAAEHLRAALEIARELAAAAPDKQQHQQSLAACLWWLGELAWSKRELADARLAFKEASNIQWQLHQANPADESITSDLVQSVSKQAQIAQAENDWPLARRLLELTLHMEKKRPQNERGVASSLATLGRLADAQGDARSAASWYSQNVACLRNLLARVPADRNAQQLLTRAMRDHGRAAAAMGDLAAAATSFEEAIEASRAWADAKLDGAAASLDIIAAQIELGRIARKKNDFATAQRIATEAWQLARAASGGEYEVARRRRYVFAALFDLGDLACDEKQWHKAQEYYSQALEAARALAESNPADSESRRDLSLCLKNLGKVAAALAQQS